MASKYVKFIWMKITYIIFQRKQNVRVLFYDIESCEKIMTRIGTNELGTKLALYYTKTEITIKLKLKLSTLKLISACYCVNIECR